MGLQQMLVYIKVATLGDHLMESWFKMLKFPKYMEYEKPARFSDPSLFWFIRHNCFIYSRQRVATVVSHELAHMWFGNLVTMKEFIYFINWDPSL